MLEGVPCCFPDSAEKCKQRLLETAADVRFTELWMSMLSPRASTSVHSPPRGRSTLSIYSETCASGSLGDPDWRRGEEGGNGAT